MVETAQGNELHYKRWHLDGVAQQLHQVWVRAQVAQDDELLLKSGFFCALQLGEKKNLNGHFLGLPDTTVDQTKRSSANLFATDNCSLHVCLGQLEDRGG